MKETRFLYWLEIFKNIPPHGKKLTHQGKSLHNWNTRIRVSIVMSSLSGTRTQWASCLFSLKSLLGYHYIKLYNPVVNESPTRESIIGT